MRVYVAGPMTGYPEYNYPAFNAAAARLAQLGYEPVNPATHPAQPTWSDYLRLALAAVVTVDAVAVLPGWEASRGARLEVHVSHALGLPVVPLDEWRVTAAPVPHGAQLLVAVTAAHATGSSSTAWTSRRRGVFTLEGPGRVTPPLNPDCRDGKHRACPGDAWDLDTDQPADCSCTCHVAAALA
ncbi:protein of unknown function, partial [Cellulosimicrobium cellulans]